MENIMDLKIKEMFLDGFSGLEIMKELKCGLLKLHNVRKNLTEEEIFIATKARFQKIHPFATQEEIEYFAKEEVERVNKYKAWLAWNEFNKPKPRIANDCW
jgi:hypothetical protein